MQLVVGLVGLWFVALAGADVRTRRLPNNVVLPGVLGAVVGVTIAPDAGGGLLMAGGIYVVAFWFGGCGGGDVKLAAVVGAMAGSVGAAALLVLCAQVLTVGQAVICGGGGRRSHIQAHGPALCASAALCCGIW
ncbi:UNVERIFIED_CONTAM: leader peptidase (prepilin peptidase)/N-methyltransferase [Williamsia faeni]